jgi:hypothetical protein
MTSKPLLIKSDFAILDVKAGRAALLKAVGFAHNNTSKARTVPITITGEIVGAWGDDDGISREFEVRVTGVSML